MFHLFCIVLLSASFTGFGFLKKGINCEVEICRLLHLTNLWNLDYRRKTMSIEV